MQDKELLEAFDRLLSGSVTPSVVRAIDAGAPGDALWRTLLDSGFLDLLLPEHAGGAGLALDAALPLLALLGRYAVPVPVAETMAARAVLAAAGHEAPQGPILLLAPQRGAQGWWQAGVPAGTLASHALVDDGTALTLVELADAPLEAPGLHGSRGANLRWPALPHARLTLARSGAGLRALAAVLRTAAIAGAGERLLELSVRYANERVQFGKPIGRQQAVQQQLAVMAEQVLLARFAAATGARAGLVPTLSAAACAKQVASAAVPVIAATAHAVHGAIGITAEYDLQLYTRRLHEWRLAEGAEGYWARLLGTERLGSDAASSVDFLRRALAPANSGNTETST